MENYEKTFQSNIIIKRHFVSVRKRKREKTNHTRSSQACNLQVINFTTVWKYTNFWMARLVFPVQIPLILF